MPADLASSIAARAPGEDAEPEVLLRVAEEIGADLAAALAVAEGSEEVADPLPLRAALPRSASERATAIERALAWARVGGARWEGIAPVVDDAGNATMRAVRPLGPGETIVVLPRTLMILSPAGAAAPRDALAAWLARAVGDARSPWAAYLATLPGDLAELPMFHARDSIAALAGTCAHALVVEAQREIRAAHTTLPDAVRAAVSLADFAWGCAIAKSRGFHAPGSIEHRIALLPVVDLFDHRLGDTTWTFDPADGNFVVSTERAFAIGEPVGFTYGDHGNTQLYVHYGFTEGQNAAAEAGLLFERVADPAAVVAGHLLWNLPLAGPVRVRVGTELDHRFERALSVARLHASRAADRARAVDGGLAAHAEIPWLGAALEADALAVLEAAARRALDALGAGEVEGDTALAVRQVREDERRVLAAVHAFARRAGDHLRDPDPQRVRAAADALTANADAADRLLRAYLLALADVLALSDR